MGVGGSNLVCLHELENKACHAIEEMEDAEGSGGIEEGDAAEFIVAHANELALFDDATKECAMWYSNHIGSSYFFWNPATKAVKKRAVTTSVIETRCIYIVY